jgi:3-dehydroquinate synthase
VTIGEVLMASLHNIVLTGFMGTGKSSVGKAVAQLLGWEFLDMDAIIESRTSKTIAEIFAQEGESVFRAMESALCQELAACARVVIATGGGALVSEENRKVMAARGLLVCLNCALDELWPRLQATTDRPMLYTRDRRARIESLLAQRAPAYRSIPRQLDTTGRAITDLAREIVAWWQGAQLQQVVLPVRTPSGEYKIHLGRQLPSGEIIREAGLTGKIGLVSNTTVGALHADRVTDDLRAAGLEVARCLLPDGERYKTLDTLRALYDALIEAELDRDSVIIALGGGVVGDVAGFAAATLLRGVRFVQMPTTLLAMVDSSVGGKVAVDHPRGKNLIGAFKQPELVIADIALLETLPPAEYRSGLAEAIKHGVIAAPSLFEHFERGGRGDELAPLAEAIRVKIEVVQEDPFERGRRAVLNLGHTFGHAIELLSDYRMRHGEAVSIGLVAAARTAEAMGLAKPELAARLVGCLSRHEMPTRLPDYAPEAIWEAMSSDKKRRGGKLRFVLPRAIGDVVITDEVSREIVVDVLSKMRIADKTE